MYKEIFVVLCLMAVVMVQAYPAEDLEASQGAVEQVVVEPSADASDLEGAESRYGGWGRGYGGWGGYGGGWNRGYGGYGGWNRGYGSLYSGGGWNRGWRHWG